MAENLPHRTPVTTPMQAADWVGELPDRLRSTFPGAAIEYRTYLQQPFLELKHAAILPALLRHLRDVEHFDMLTDLSAVDRQPAEERFEVVYILYSFSQNIRLRVKVHAVRQGGDPPEFRIPSVVEIWRGADWMEREAYDMFGIEFDGHPKLTRILMPDGWRGFPLRKDYSITGVDEDWVRANIEPRAAEESQ